VAVRRDSIWIVRNSPRSRRFLARNPARRLAAAWPAWPRCAVSLYRTSFWRASIHPQTFALPNTSVHTTDAQSARPTPTRHLRTSPPSSLGATRFPLISRRGARQVAGSPRPKNRAPRSNAAAESPSTSVIVPPVPIHLQNRAAQEPPRLAGKRRNGSVELQHRRAILARSGSQLPHLLSATWRLFPSPSSSVFC
jgi:hypothetical protein